MAKILIACEYSGIVRDAFAAKGHEAWSCDLLPTERPGPHIQDDVSKHLGPCQANNFKGWDMMIAHPPCTHLACSGAKWFEEKKRDGRQKEAIDFFMLFVNAPIPRICIENPVGIMSRVYKKATQIIQPYYFGDEARKTTCLWLKNLPRLFHAKQVDMFNQNVTHVPQGEIITFKSGKTMSKWYADAGHLNKSERSKIRSKSFIGIANAMAAQWNF